MIIVRPRGPIAAMTVVSLVPLGKLTMRVPASVPASTVSLSWDDAVGVLLVSDCLASLAVVLLFAWDASGVVVATFGTPPPIGTPMTATYPAMKAAIRPLPSGARDNPT